jgi:uncharacterized protein
MLAAALLLSFAGPAPAPPSAPPSSSGGSALSAEELRAHARQVEEWRQGRIRRLTSDEGWLAVAGLFWLKEGANPFGSGKDNAVVLPGPIPAKVGVFHLAKGVVTVELPAASPVTLAGQPLTGKRELRPDVPGPADVLAVGDLRLLVIPRDGRVGIRMRDLNSPQRKAFQGIESFPVRPEYRVRARFIPHQNRTSIKVPNVLGGVTAMTSPGRLHFELGGQALSLDAVLEEPTDKRLFIIFRDATAGRETYGAGRFVYTEALPEKGEVVVDFNKAYNPPCAFTAFATCPLPPPQNRVRLRIEAGEKRVAGH